MSATSGDGYDIIESGSQLAHFVSQIEHACVLHAATEFAKLHSIPIVLIGVDTEAA